MSQVTSHAWCLPSTGWAPTLSGPGTAGCPGCLAEQSRHEEVQVGKGDHVHAGLGRSAMSCSRKDRPTYGGQRQMGQVTVGGQGQLYGSESNVMERIIINAIGLICVFYWLVDWVGGGVGLHFSVQHLKQGCPAKNIYVPIWIVLDLAGEESTIPDPSSPSTAGSELSGSHTGSDSSQPPPSGLLNNAKLFVAQSEKYKTIIYTKMFFLEKKFRRKFTYDMSKEILDQTAKV